MKVDARRADSLCAAPPLELRALLLYGPNEGLARERALKAARAIVPDATDPFRLSDLAPAAVKDDPARLADELGAFAFGGGRRVVSLRGATDGLAAAIESALDIPGDALLIVEAGELGPRSSLRKLFEGATNAAALPCYDDGVEAAEAIVIKELAGAGLSIEDDALARLIERAGSDRGQLRRALATLSLYMATPGARAVTRGDVDAVVGDAAELSLDELCDAVGLGDLARLDRAIMRAEREGLHAVALLRAVGRHLARLHRVTAEAASGRSIESAMAALRPPIFYANQAGFRRQAGLWSVARLSDALGLLQDAEADCKTSGLPVESVAARTLLRIAGAARSGRAGA